MKSKVYFSRTLTSANVVRMYEALGIALPGKVALKLHSGEEGNQNFLGPEWFKDIVEKLDATVVECNTAYPGERDTTPKHLALLKRHGWSKAFKVDLLDAEGPDAVLPIPDGHVIQKDYIGKNLLNYDSLLVVSHFKGHPMGGYGGALKQLSIGCASSYGKLHIHSAGSDDPSAIWTADHDRFLEAMADAASAVDKHFGEGKIAFISILKNMSVDCDCCSEAEDPCLKDIGILSSLDPLAIDQAALDLVQKSGDPGVSHFMERVNSRHGFHTLEAASKLDFGKRDYELIDLDKE